VATGINPMLVLSRLAQAANRGGKIAYRIAALRATTGCDGMIAALSQKIKMTPEASNREVKACRQ